MGNNCFKGWGMLFPKWRDILLIFDFFPQKSGFTGVGYPKETPVALADYVEKNNLQDKMQFELFVGASTNPLVEDR